MIGNGCSDQLPDFKLCLVVLKTYDKIPTTIASVNNLSLAYSFVITCEGTKKRVMHLFLSLYVSHSLLAKECVSRFH